MFMIQPYGIMQTQPKYTSGNPISSRALSTVNSSMFTCMVFPDLDIEFFGVASKVPVNESAYNLTCYKSTSAHRDIT